MDRDTLVDYLDGYLNLSSFRDYGPQGLQVECYRPGYKPHPGRLNEPQPDRVDGPQSGRPNGPR